MRTDSAFRIIKAPTQVLYRALLNPTAVARWRAPEGMTCTVESFHAHEGGSYRMTLAYTDEAHATAGKTSEHADAVRGRFAKLVPNERVVEEVEFDSADPAFTGTMTITTTLVPVMGGTRVTIACENVPAGIRAADHRKGLESTLANLAAFTERRGR